MKWQKLQRIISVIFLVLVIVSLLLYAIFGDSFDLGKLREYLKNFGIWAPLIFIILYIFATIFIPSTPFMAVAGILFGFKYGLLYTIIGGFFSSIFMFTVARQLGKTQVDKILKYKYMKYLDKYNKRLESGGTWDLIILRALPIMPFNVLNILMGVSRIKKSEYVIGTTIGLIPSNVLAVYFGNVISKLF